MRETLKRWWPVIRVVLMLTVLVGIGLQFDRVLRSPDLQTPDRTRTPGGILLEAAAAARPEWLALAALLYTAGQGFSAVFWYGMMRHCGQRLSGVGAARAYYVSQLGKYSPVKGTAVVLRATFAAEAGARPAVAALLAGYETMVGMTAGALLAVAILALLPSEDPRLFWVALGLVALAGVPILPGFFNRVTRTVDRYRQADTIPMPPVGYRPGLVGLAVIAGGWLTLGASLEAFLQALAADARGWTVEGWLRNSGYVALSWVAGFLVFFLPGGLGIRELVLERCLAPSLGPRAVVAALLLRVLWTLTEVVVSGLLYWMPVRPAAVAAADTPTPAAESS